MFKERMKTASKQHEYKDHDWANYFLVNWNDVTTFPFVFENASNQNQLKYTFTHQQILSLSNAFRFIALNELLTEKKKRFVKKQIPNSL